MIGGRDPLLEPVDIARSTGPTDRLLGPGGVPWSNELRDHELVQNTELLYENLNREPTAQGIDGEQANFLNSHSQVTAMGLCEMA